VRLILTLEYDGTPFHGWAAQPGLATVEEALRAALDVDGNDLTERVDSGIGAPGNSEVLDRRKRLPERCPKRALDSR